MAKKTSKKSGRKKNPAAEAPAQALGAVDLVGLDDIRGQGHAIGVLRSALETGRVHHAWIFSGPVGVGKFTTACAFGAELLGCGAGDGQAGGARGLIRGGSHPGFHVVRKELATVSSDASVRGRKLATIPRAVVDEFLIEPIARTGGVSVEGAAASKVFVIDEAELLDAGTQNTLLKTLEEPAPGSVIVLVTSHEDRLLPTVRSRCQRVSFPPVDDESMRAVLAARAPTMPEGAADWLTAFADGSPGVALEFAEQGLWRWHEELSPMLGALASGRAAPTLGETLYGLVSGQAEASVQGQPLASKDAANKRWSGRLAAYLGRWARDGLHAAAQRSDGVDVWVGAIGAVERLDRSVRSNVNLAITFEHAAAELHGALVGVPAGR